MMYNNKNRIPHLIKEIIKMNSVFDFIHNNNFLQPPRIPDRFTYFGAY